MDHVRDDIEVFCAAGLFWAKSARPKSVSPSCLPKNGPKSSTQRNRFRRCEQV